MLLSTRLLPASILLELLITGVFLLRLLIDHFELNILEWEVDRSDQSILIILLVLLLLFKDVYVSVNVRPLLVFS